MSDIRPFARADAGAVAALFQKTFRDSEAPPSGALEAYLVEAYLEHPWYDPENAARVHVSDEGRVTGFVGVFPGRFLHAGKEIRVAIPGTLMVENPEREPLAGAKLLRSVVKGPQDVALSETTNDISQALWDRLGGRIVPAMSLDWFRVFRPGAAAVALLAEKHPAASMLKPFAPLGDLVVRIFADTRLAPPALPRRYSVDPAPDDAAFAAAVLRLSEQYVLRPAWSEADIVWLLRHAAKKERYGAMHRAIVHNAAGGIAGCYVYHGKPGGAARVLQVLAAKDEAGNVLDCLFNDAAEKRIALLRGRSTPDFESELVPRSSFFMHRAAMAVHPSRGVLPDAVLSGAALVTGLAGESWTRLVGGMFV